MRSGAEQFADWIERRWPLSERRQRDCSEYFGWDESFTSQLLRGSRRPGLANAIRIERMSGIPAKAWVSSELDESAETVPARARNRKIDRT